MKEPQDATLLAARIARAYPALSAYSAATLAEELCRIERMQRRHAERCCSGSDGGYVRWRSLAREDDNAGSPRVLEHDPVAEERAGKRIDRHVSAWVDTLAERQTGNRGAITAAPLIELEGDPRGAVLKVRLPGEAEAVSV